jgi:hypothetical protein
MTRGRPSRAAEGGGRGRGGRGGKGLRCTVLYSIHTNSTCTNRGGGGGGRPAGIQPVGQQLAALVPGILGERGGGADRVGREDRATARTGSGPVPLPSQHTRESWGEKLL